MGLLKHIRSRSRLRPSPSGGTGIFQPSRYHQHSRALSSSGLDHTKSLPPKVLAKIFTYVCPHTADYSYVDCENSQIGDGCLLCDMRDIAHCALVCRAWKEQAVPLLYGSIRIDAVHYCVLEEELAEQRKKKTKHFRSKGSVDPGEVPAIRLSLLCRTVRENRHRAAMVYFLKVAYMTRETARSDLARTVTALFNLRYVDLPNGFYNGSRDCMTLRQELLENCPQIRKMSFRRGAEQALALLVRGYWPHLEILEIQELAVEPMLMRSVLGALPALQELRLDTLDWMNDSMFAPALGQVPDFPPVHMLKLIRIRHISARGLEALMANPANCEQLSSLTLENCKIPVTDLPIILAAATSLRHLSVTRSVANSLDFMTQQRPPLASQSLHTLHYEITSSEQHSAGLMKPAESYYVYLASSLHLNALPALRTLYVRDHGFPDLLLVSTPLRPPHPSPPIIAETSKNPFLSPFPASHASTGFTQTLEVLAKGPRDSEWLFTSVAPTSRNPHAHLRTATSPSLSSNTDRPSSSHSHSASLGVGPGAGLSPSWAQGGFGTGDARKSVIVGNGFGGFLAMQDDDAASAQRPRTAGGNADGAARGTTRWGAPPSSSGSNLLEVPLPAGAAGTGSHAAGGGGGWRHSFLNPMSGAKAPHKKSESRHDLWR